MSYQYDIALIEWLRNVGSEKQRRSYLISFLAFLDFLKDQGWKNPSGVSVLDRHKQNRKSSDNETKYELDYLIPKFIQWLKETRGLKHNSAIRKSAQIRGFFKFHQEPLRIKRKQKMQLSDLFLKNREKIKELTTTLKQIKKETLAYETRIDNIQETVARLERLLGDNQIGFQRMTTKINDRLDWLEIKTKKRENAP